MDNAKRTVLVAALSVYAELLGENTEQLDLEQGKGKGKASDDDVDLKAEMQTQIKICSELSDQIRDATSGKDIARMFEVACPEPCKKQEIGQKKPPNENTVASGNLWENTSFQGFYAPTAASSQPPIRSSPNPPKAYVIDNEPYTNPFTGFPVIQELGFEAGPSNTSRPPLRIAPRPPTVPSRPLSRRTGSSEPPTRPPPKPQHLRARPLVPPKPMIDPSTLLPPERKAPLPPPSANSSPTRSATLPPQRPAPLLPPFPTLEPQEVERPLAISAPLEHGLPPMSDKEYGGPMTEQFWSTTSVVNVQLPPPPAPYDWEADIQDVREESRRNNEQVTKLSQKSKYLRYITELARKATGSMRSTTRTAKVYQSEHVSPSTRDMPNIPEQLAVELPAEIPAELPGYFANSESALGFSRRESQETSPVAFVTTSDIHRLSVASDSSVAGSYMWSLSSGLSSRTSLSPTSPSTCSSPIPQEDSFSSSRRASYTNSNFGLRKSKSRMSSPPMGNSLQRSISISALPSVDLGGKENLNFSATTSMQMNRPFSATGKATPIAKAEEPHLDERQTTSTSSSQPFKSNNFTNSQFTLDSMLARDLSFDGSHYTVWKKPSSSFSKFPYIRNRRAPRMGYIRKLQSTPIHPFPPGTNSPWKDHIEADQAFARYLLLQEEQELQEERDLLLAYKINNGTADDEDKELAYFMHRESNKLIEETIPITGPVTQANPDLWGMDPGTWKAQIDCFEAHRLDKELNSQNSADEANFLEAKRLQERFDEEAKNEEAWEQWKGNNVGTCTSCLEDHAREELVQECEHGYCNECLQNAFEAALKSRAPFQCCKKALSVKECLGLEDGFVAEYEEMMLELSTPNPMFCSNAQCAKFLPPRVIVGDIGTCEKCSAQTCRHCRQGTHPGTFCAEDKETEAVKKLAKKKGWKTCPGCNHLIERREGCLHMTCSRCQTAFCYRCSRPWKDCGSACPITSLFN